MHKSFHLIKSYQNEIFKILAGVITKDTHKNGKIFFKD